MSKFNPGRGMALLCALLLTLVLATPQALVGAEPTSPAHHLQSLQSLSEPPPPTLPSIHEWTVANNTRVLFVENRELPMVDVAVSFAAGSIYDGHSPGLAAMMMQILTEGPHALDQLGVELNLGLGKERATIGLRSLSDQTVLAPALHLLANLLAHPDFSEAGVARAQSEVAALSIAELKNPESRALHHVYNALYPRQPIAQSTYGSLKTLRRIDAQQLRDFHRRAYTASNAQIAIVGDLTAEQAKAFSQQIAEALPTGPALAVPLPIQSPMTTSHITHLEDSIPQSLLVMGQNALPIEHPDSMATRIGHGIFDDILNAQLREKYSATYGVISHTFRSSHAAPWVISLYTPPHYSTSAAEQVTRLYARFLQDGPTQAQISAIKKTLLRSMPRYTSSNKYTLSEMVLLNRFNQPLDFSHKIQRVQTLTREQIKTAMARHFSADTWVRLTLGPVVAQKPLPLAEALDENTVQSCLSSNSTHTLSPLNSWGTRLCCGNLGVPLYQSHDENLSVHLSCPCTPL